MLFNSLEFLVFFPVVTLLYWLLPHGWRWLHLLLASCAFYMFFIPEYILILFFTIIIDYIAGIQIENAQGKKRKWYLIISLIANVGVLMVFKYYNFFIDNINESFRYAEIKGELPLLGIILPIGLSFHTFQAMSYTIEVYRGNHAAERHFGIYALYVMFYPQLVAGPIERPQNVLFQFHRRHTFDMGQFTDGLRLMAWGLFKKVVIADRLSIYVDIVYDNPAMYGPFNHIIAIVLFAIQIYCDFSGYSDMALGAARAIGFELMVNFNRPYIARNIQDFWRRWHISLSTWFRDYVYIPLGGSRVSQSRFYVNTAIIFLVSGFWHGASWNFVIWGGLHALFSIILMLYSRFIADRFGIKLPWLMSFLLTMASVCLAWVFFRANTFHDAKLVLSQIFTWNTSRPFQAMLTSEGGAEFAGTSMVLAVVMVAIMFLIERYTLPRLEELKHKPWLDISFFLFALLSVIFLGVFQRDSFIYFQF